MKYKIRLVLKLKWTQRKQYTQTLDDQFIASPELQ